MSGEQRFSANDAASRFVITLSINRWTIPALAVRVVHFLPIVLPLFSFAVHSHLPVRVCACGCRDVSAQLHQEVVRSL